MPRSLNAVAIAAAVLVSSLASAQQSKAVPSTTAAKPTATPSRSAAAPAPQPLTRDGYLRKIDTSFARIDTNHDGNISRAELDAEHVRQGKAIDAMLAKRRQDAFAKLDTNKDGQLSQAEFNAGVPIPKRARTDAGQAIARWDSNKDGKVTLIEYRAPALTGFEKMDANRDGVVSIDEARKGQTAAGPK